MSNNIFEIRNLSCSYSGNSQDKVLYIDKLDIPRGKIIFFIGASGTGKSTLLEALGLMNSTITGGRISFLPASDLPVDYQAVWNQQDQSSSASTLRKEHFSFIFQQTNLMESFSAHENVCLAEMIQSDLQHKEALKSSIPLLEEVGLSKALVTPETQSKNLSGGQRQRLAFVRALSKNFTVLFGDEPTGNLDEFNAHELLRLIQKNLSSQQSVIISSHDIDLALNYADQIVVITKSKEGNFGTIEKENVFNLTTATPTYKSKLRERLPTFYAGQNIDSKVKGTSLQKEQADGTAIFDYRQLFKKKEGKALRGKSYENLAALVSMLCLTLLGLGFANGSLSYLQEKLNNPFVNWLSVEVPWIKSDVHELMDSLNSTSIKERFSLAEVKTFANDPVVFRDLLRQGNYLAYGRSFDVNEMGANSLLDVILSPSNLLAGSSKGFDNNQDLSLIVTANFLAKFHYPPDTSFVLMELNTDSTTLAVPIPIKAIVKEIPGKNGFIFTSCFYRALRSTGRTNTFDIRNPDLNKNLQIYTGNLEAHAVEFAAHAEDFFNQNPNLRSKYQPDINIYPYGYTHNGGFYVEIGMLHDDPDNINVRTIDSLYQKLISFQGLKSEIESRRVYMFEATGNCSVDRRADGLSINFRPEGLSKVRELANYIRETYNTPDEQQILEVDITKVKEKENFTFLSGMARVIAFILLIFSTISVGLFISHILQMHLSKISMNIGTIQAFGLSSKETLSIYLVIIMRFVMISSGLAAIAAISIGNVIDFILRAKLNLEPGTHYFKLFDWFTFWAVLLILSAGLIMARYTIHKMLAKTPGDLIYNR